MGRMQIACHRCKVLNFSGYMFLLCKCVSKTDSVLLYEYCRRRSICHKGVGFTRWACLPRSTGKYRRNLICRRNQVLSFAWLDNCPFNQKTVDGEAFNGCFGESDRWFTYSLQCPLRLPGVASRTLALCFLGARCRCAGGQGAGGAGGGSSGWIPAGWLWPSAPCDARSVWLSKCGAQG